MFVAKSRRRRRRGRPARTPLCAAAAGAGASWRFYWSTARTWVCDEAGLTASIWRRLGCTKVASQLRAAGASGGAKDHRADGTRRHRARGKSRDRPGDVPAAEDKRMCEGPGRVGEEGRAAAAEAAQSAADSDSD